MKKNLIIIAVFSLMALSLYSQSPPDTLWTRTFGGNDYDHGECIQNTMDGGYIILGHTMSFGAGNYDIWLIKTDSNGNEVWNQTFGGSSNDYGYSVQQTTDGGYIVTGHTSSFGNGNLDVWLIKTDSNGTEEWNQTFGGIYWEGGYSVRQTSDGGYIITGFIDTGDYDVWLIKTDSNGNEEWNQTFGGNDYEIGGCVQITNDGGYIIAGETTSFGAGSIDYWLIRTNANGDSLWTKTFGGISGDSAQFVIQTLDGGFIIVGSSYINMNDCLVIKTDENGNAVWQQTFGGDRTDYVYCVQQTTDNGFIICGESDSFSNPQSQDIWLIKIDENGNEKWQQTFGGNGGDRSKYILQNSDGSFIIAGETLSYGSGLSDFWILKTDNFSVDFISNRTDGYTPLEAKFTDKTYSFEEIISWEWDFQNNGSIDSYEQNPIYIYFLGESR